MSKVKTKKHDTFIDMTAMSDVTVLLLTFFMLNATFIPKEPISVNAPQSVQDIQIPELNLATVLISPKGQVWMTLDKPEDKQMMLELIGLDYGIQFTPEQTISFREATAIGVPIASLQGFLNLPLEDQDRLLQESSIPADSANNQLKSWVELAKRVNKDLTFAIKADVSTPYTEVEKVFGTFQDAKVNRFNLITNLRGMPELDIQ